MSHYRIMTRHNQTAPATECDRWPDGEGGPDHPTLSAAFKVIKKLMRQGHKPRKFALIAVENKGVERNLNAEETTQFNAALGRKK
jgi:hypothetical protein